MDRMTVFFPADNDRGFVQAVVLADEWPHFEALGAVKTCDQVKQEEKPKRGRPRKTDAQIVADTQGD